MAGPVRYTCRMERPFPDLEKEFEFCEWEVDEGVKAIKLDCAKSNNRYVVTRNMDDARDKYPWRISRFDLDSGEPYGHAYGKNPAHALNEWASKWEKCKVTAVRTVSGEGDFGRPSLGKLTKTPGSNAPSLEARRVIGAFLRGETARGACGKRKGVRTCAIVSTGNTLEIGGETVASRDRGQMQVCVSPKTEMVAKGRRRHETEEAKDIRVAASMLLRKIAGIGVRTSPSGDRLLAARGRASMLLPRMCVDVQLPKKKIALLLSTTSAVEAARARYKTEFPSSRQVDNMRKVLAAEQRTAALRKAQVARRAAPTREPEHEFDVTPAPEDRGAPLDVDELLEPVFPADLPAESWETETAPPLPTDVPHPTNPESFVAFTRDYIPSLRSPVKREMAEAWRLYLMDPQNERRPGSSGTIPPGPDYEKKKAAAREIELDLAGEYGIVDPIHSFMPPDVARRSAIQAAASRRAAATRARKGKGRKGTVDPNVLEHMEWLRQGRRLVDPEDWQG